MLVPEEGCLLRVFIGESDRHEGLPLYEWIVRKAREQGLAGATVLRGIMGFGAHSGAHSVRTEKLPEDLPVVVELVDTREHLEAFLAIVDSAVEEGLATFEKAQVRFYRPGKPW
jgi:PII-like signaling protein